MCPGRYGPVYLHDDEKHENVIDFYKWGLTPPFLDSEKDFNAFDCRKDHLTGERSLWNHAKQRQRCLVFAEGYFEWFNHKKEKVPYFVKRKDTNLMCLAGLWEKNEKVSDQPLFTYTIVTTEAPDEIKWLKNRMPVILDPEKDKELIEKWIDPEVRWEQHQDELMDSLPQYDPGNLVIYEVPKEIGKVTNNYKDLTRPVSDKNESTTQGKKTATTKRTSSSRKKEQKPPDDDAAHNDAYEKDKEEEREENVVRPEDEAELEDEQEQNDPPALEESEDVGTKEREPKLRRKDYLSSENTTTEPIMEEKNQEELARDESASSSGDGHEENDDFIAPEDEEEEAPIREVDDPLLEEEADFPLEEEDEE
jgi:putative SOS response-associated peptidase YedK